MKRRLVCGVFHASSQPAHLDKTCAKPEHHFCVKEPFSHHLWTIYLSIFGPFFHHFFRSNEGRIRRREISPFKWCPGFTHRAGIRRETSRRNGQPRSLCQRSHSPTKPMRCRQCRLHPKSFTESMSQLRSCVRIYLLPVTIKTSAGQPAEVSTYHKKGEWCKCASAPIGCTVCRALTSTTDRRTRWKGQHAASLVH